MGGGGDFPIGCEGSGKSGTDGVSDGRWPPQKQQPIIVTQSVSKTGFWAAAADLVKRRGVWLAVVAGATAWAGQHFGYEWLGTSLSLGLAVGAVGSWIAENRKQRKGEEALQGKARFVNFIGWTTVPIVFALVLGWSGYNLTHEIFDSSNLDKAMNATQQAAITGRDLYGGVPGQYAYGIETEMSGVELDVKTGKATPYKDRTFKMNYRVFRKDIFCPNEPRQSEGTKEQTWRVYGTPEAKL